MNTHLPEIQEAIQLYHDGKFQESRDRLRNFLTQQPANIDALLWLAKVSPDPQEAVHAAQLALKLEPANEVAQRAVMAVKQASKQTDQAELLTAIGTSTGMTLAQARSVNWLFRGINRPIGEVLDDGTITLRDLWWALENAYDARIRDAVRTILLSHLVGAEPKEPPPPLKVITGSRYAEVQERRSLILFSLVSGAVITLLSALLITTPAVALWMLAQGQRLSCGLGFWLALIGIIGGAWIIFKLADQYADQADQYRSGRWGEERVVDQLRYLLDGQWTLFRNFEWPNRRAGDVDLVLVGPGGVWALEVKTYSGQVRNVGDRWERKGRWGWRKLTNHPGQQARRNAAQLKDYLKGHGVDVGFVQRAVVWAGGSLSVKDSAIPVWTQEELPDNVQETWQNRSLSEEVVERVVEVLNEAIEGRD